MLHSLQVPQVEQVTHLGIKRKEKKNDPLVKGPYSRGTGSMGNMNHWLGAHTRALGTVFVSNSLYPERWQVVVGLSAHPPGNAQNRSDSFGNVRLAEVTSTVSEEFLFFHGVPESHLSEIWAY